ncbi:ABC transporter permease [Spelaeicoccus albus]|uniref:Oligopeptide transport system permease protein n=1 Tax=Spelaeicoccus albus TaxID=1280376 RepID=A0A7Z0ABG7_9MICO|nr:ABC transporter permease [Spelaeicoccus albus]NYI66785.1 oligopeptide transport system permease protein [Spelaeicoccus albus]
MPNKSTRVRPGQERFVAPLDETPLQDVDAVTSESAGASLWKDAGQSLIRNPVFIISAVLILLILLAIVWPKLFTSADPTYCTLDNTLGAPRSGHPLGFNQQGCDIFARVIYGTRASVAVGILTTLAVVIIGGVVGAVSGFLGGWVDAVLSRLIDIFFAVPFILGAIVLMQLFRDHAGIWSMAAVLAAFAWTQIARIMRGAVISMKNSDFVTASTAIGTSSMKNLVRHVVPNAIAPVIVTATVSLGIYIVAEATLSYLGLGLPTSIVSWGADIAAAQDLIRTNPEALFYPAAALAITVLSFIMLGDAVRDTLDPKTRKR